VQATIRVEPKGSALIVFEQATPASAEQVSIPEGRQEPEKLVTISKS